MVQAKHHKKTKPRKQHDGCLLTQVKQHGKLDAVAEFRSQLDVLGLKIIQVTADGNCFFRALADQLEGNEEEHKKYRDMVVQYILNHREDFEPFIEDDVPFDEYCQSMEKDGTWAGHMELQAASLVTRRNICIHRLRSPRWYINNFSSHGASMIHLCYHDGEHYNSVRLKEDSCEGPAKPIIIEVDANFPIMDHNKKLTVNESKGSSRKRTFDARSIKMVMAGTGCQDVDKVEQVLQEVDGDVDAAVEFLIADQDSDDNVHASEDNVYHGDDQNEICGRPETASMNTKCEAGVARSNPQPVQSHSIQHEDKKIPRNKECPCGSKKKYKACCGSAKGKSSASLVINDKSAASKGRKETKRSRKRESIKEVPGNGSRPLPDMGALCI
ncbi:OVARIAN TUMOR DOMAIN-containing deubiquitinating enzyme 7 isoform X2 [Phoenix dactylifera]|uniref:OVARIAN TUMOR DOMAIN-containing deubiquitinating enzyme 7 isoform X2 n=1 Tax=Phoenix dactylifera TaxID=42345 RepID=A0A8B8J4B2_PHODC|nr:OVARIAN TUMOR DOMAIN-containing deubiquitinating enzyme 7 isoform X2 [Phoenix dactylifera]XP_038984120.1 OVARIAN TUMOR DOMAIN-containing deubiquitinating enzyme 7 isoform X2 [Phoenix dactylifera]